MSGAADVFNTGNQENRSTPISSHFTDNPNLKMVQHMANASTQDNRVDRNNPLAHFPDANNLKMVQIGNNFYIFV